MKATIIHGGATITVKGTPDEIAEVVRKLADPPPGYVGAPYSPFIWQWPYNTWDTGWGVTSDRFTLGDVPGASAITVTEKS